jgi:hypothetical protein
MPKRAVVAFLLAASLVLLAAPARAGDGYPSQSGCDGGRRAAEGQWYGVPGQGSYYWWYRIGGWNWVGDAWYQIYQNNNWECGPFGWPTSWAYDVHDRSPLYQPGEWLRQDFEFLSMNFYHGRWYFCSNATGQCAAG